MTKINVVIKAEINPTEDPEKVREAIGNIAGNAERFVFKSKHI